MNAKTLLDRLFSKRVIIGYSINGKTITVITYNNSDVDKILNKLNDDGYKIHIIRLSNHPEILN